MINYNDSIIAISSARGEAAIGVIRISGSGIVQYINKVLDKPIPSNSHRTAFFRKIVDEKDDIDQVIILPFQSPHSYTGEDVVEIYAHGNQILLDSIVQNIIKKCGFRIAEPGEFTRRAFLNRKMDLTQAEAVMNLISAKNEHAAKISLKNLEGAVKNYLSDIRLQLVEILSLIETELDFAEEELEFSDRVEVKNMLLSMFDKIEGAIDSFQKSRYIREGLKVAIIGKPNVGKSSLLNRILGEERAIVTEQPGTTRDFIREKIQLSGYSVYFIDTAGIRSSENTIEEKGIALGKQIIDKSDLILALFESHLELNEDDFDILEILSSNEKETFLCLNKIDLEINRDTKAKLEKLNYPLFEISTKSGGGVDQLIQAIIYYLEENSLFTDSEIIIASERQYQIMIKTKESLQNLLQKDLSLIPSDMLAFDLREIMEYIGELTGEVRTDDILNNIFSRFCIGK